MTERNHFIDTMKGMLIIFVILLHSSILPEERLMAGFPYWANMAVPAFMFISGYVCYVSFDKKKMWTFRELYAPKGLFARLLRFVIPFSIAYAAEWIVFRIFGIYQVNIVTYGLRAAFIEYLLGGKGQGSYYFPIMVQFVLLFPLIFLLTKKHRNAGFLCLSLINILYEFLKNILGMSDYTYRFLIFRYLFIISAGAYLASVINDKKEKFFYRYIVLFIANILVGAIAITVVSYTDYSPVIFNMWKATSMPTSFYVFGVLSLLILFVNKGVATLEYIGKASFNIFLVQMIYYNFADRISSFVGSKVRFVLLSLLVCVVIGIGFYFIENKITKYIIKKLRV